jgi:hypothetical protein
MKEKELTEKEEIKKVIVQLIKKYPNDYELGKFMRKYYQENERVFKVLSEQTT